jgi:hypothetical protein
MSEDDKHPIRPDKAREQATEYLGVMADIAFDLGDGATWVLPNPALMPPPMKRRYMEHLRFMSEDLDTVERTDPITKETRQVQKYPLRRKGKLINDEELLAVALMGEDGDYEKYVKDGTLPETYQRFLNAGGVPGQIGTAWQMMERQLRERARQDSKSL